MAERTFIRNFSNFKGLNQSLNELTRGPEFAELAKNVEVLDDGSLGLKRGEKFFSGLFSGVLNENAFCGIFSHTYLDLITGEAKSDLLVGLEYLWKLKWGSILVSNSAVGTHTLSFLPSQSSGEFVLTLTDNGSVTLSQAFGDGSDYLTYSLISLVAAINAKSASGWSAVLTPYGVVRGTPGAARGIATPLDINTGYTLSVGDTVGLVGPGAAPDYSLHKISHIVSGATPSISFAPGSDTDAAAAYIVDGSPIIAVGHENAAAFPITASTSIGVSGVSFPIPYWTRTASRRTDAFRQIYLGSMEYLFSAKRKLCSVTNANNCLYIGGHFRQGNFSYNIGLPKYDGQALYNAGLCPPDITAVVQTGAGGLLTAGEYRYFVTAQLTDAQGNIIESSPGGATGISIPQVITVGSVSLQTQLTVRDPLLDNYDLTAENRSCYYGNQQVATINGAQAGIVGTAGILVVAGHSIEPGATLYIYDTTAGAIVERTCTSVTTTRLYFSGANITSVDPAVYAYISNGTKTRIWRTTVNNNTYYLVGERPTSHATFTFVDNIADTTISAGEALFIPEAGLENDPPPSLALLCSHQGCLIGANRNRRNNTGPLSYYLAEPNTVYKSLPGLPESMPIASASFDLPSTTTGEITAIASDGDSMLMAAKASAIYNIVGDLETNTFQITAVTEGDVGVPSHSSLQRIKEVFIFPSFQGFFTYAKGTLSASFNQRLISSFRRNFYKQVDGVLISSSNQQKLVVNHSVSYHDTQKQQYVCYIPAELGIPGSAGFIQPSSYGTIFKYQYAKDAWVTEEMGASNDINMFGGAVIHDFVPYFISIRGGSSTSPIGVFSKLDSGTDLDFISNALKINADVATYWEALGDIDTFKTFLRIKLLSFGRLLTDGFPANMYGRVRTYANFIGLRNSWLSPVTTNSVSFTSFTTGSPARPAFPNHLLEQEFQLNKKLRAIQLRFTNDATSNTKMQDWQITGYEIVVDGNYEAEDIQK